MQRIHRITAVLLMLLAPGADAASQGMGRVSMNGQIQASACSIHTDDIWQEIPFGVVSTQTLDNGGEVRPVKIRLVNCLLEQEGDGVWRGVEVTFEGERSTVRNDLFAVSGQAKGLALQLSDTHGHFAKPGEPLPEVLLNPQNNYLDYRLKVMGTGEPLQLGRWSGVIRFMVAWR